MADAASFAARTAHHGEGRLLGRDAEQRRVGSLLEAARGGRGGALLVCGEPGIGKTALLETTASQAVSEGFRLLRVDGYEAEAALPFASVHRLTIPFREHLPVLPERQQQALQVATGAVDGPPPDRYLVGLGVLGLLASASTAPAGEAIPAGEAAPPIVCVVDDAHLLDAESLDVLAFVARRLEAERVALVFAARDESWVAERMAGLPVLRLGGLGTEAAVRLLRSVLREPIDTAAAARIAGATGGSPLALIDLADELGVQQLTRSSVAVEPIPVGSRLEACYLRQVRKADPRLQAWLLVAAAESTGDVDLIRAASRRLGIVDVVGDEAELAGLVELGASLSFRHPLVRSATYHGAPGAERRRAHRALSAEAEARGIVELAAWHAAKATVGTDEQVADRLERAADLAGHRGGLMSRASVLTQAAALTPPGPARNGRLVAAAEAALAAGAAGLAKSLADEVAEASEAGGSGETGGEALDPVTRGRLTKVRVDHTFFTAGPAVVRGAADMLAVAACFHGHDVGAEQDALLDAFHRALAVERQGREVSLPVLGRRLLDGAGLAHGVAGTILRALGTYILRPYREAVPELRAALDVVSGLTGADLMRYGAISIALTTALWDETATRDILERTAAAAREWGALPVLDTTLWILSLTLLHSGTPRLADQYVEQVRELRRAIGYDAEHVVNVALLAWSGGPRDQVEAAADAARAAGFGGVYASGVGALAVRDLAEGRYDDAYARLKPLVDDPFLQVTPLEYPDFVEAASRSGRLAQAVGVVALLEDLASVNGSVWTRGAAHRSRALVSDDREAEAHYAAAVATLRPTVLTVQLGRSHLVYGEWLRRARRRREAREHLRRAVEIFEGAGAPAFAQRARAELEATGQRLPAGQPREALDLTPQERTVARLAAAGRTNAEISATMFISTNTVDYHLRKIFQKLGVTSRRQLAGRLEESRAGVL
ncbi:LuxR family transcriptional regulator [Parafrankia colletiae]|uniref:LuxR family transcriptional regulator n=1 Tax=Parafrankia colletiae TaxID=573497 RepID=A0A1S1QHP4_9ACTN|nr:LuxR family transcriptional regulator [Parafrankia colletiae]MCK9902300.1 LuxR family transcriptional regulator [Frankia sp. Cpl3]OHV33126.1 LuxR family transcriptional regulator [Parafrankia colletiae]